MPRHRQSKIVALLLLPVKIASSRLFHTSSPGSARGAARPILYIAKADTLTKATPLHTPNEPTHTHESHTTPRDLHQTKKPGCWVQYNQQSAATRLALNSFLVCLLSYATIVHLRRTANPFVISYELHNEIPSVAFMCVYISTISSSCCSSSTFKRLPSLLMRLAQKSKL